ncbi:MAG: PLP-dependent transferase [Methylibium sp.]|uniref:PLP-dependent transferase n=1 Tax=Methylibium sp. TaxID=2067992 RepID=UPI00178E947D|nr:PLP-dependent transferase [Methylibium sp.]MBA3595935.1 PLP-dependent transferase [Methylibium sp.]
MSEGDNDSATDRLTTGLIHHRYQPPAGFGAVPPGVFKASTVIFKDTAALRARRWQDKTGYTYGLHGTPTTFTLEERIASLEGGRHTLLAPSGLAAIALVDLALLAAGDEVLLPANVYGPSRELARHELARLGVAHRLYDPLDATALADMIGPQTKLVWLEAAGSVTMEFPDLAGLVAACKARDVITALDNTWGAGIAFAPFDCGVDISMQALTKYASGGADVLMGSVTTRDDALHQRLKTTHMRLGLGVGANDAELVLRSLPSLVLRYTAQDAAARRLAAWWHGRSEVVQILHPAFEGAPGHAHWASACRAAAGLFSVVFDARYTQAQVDAFLDTLRLFKLGYSWAGPVSLVVPYDLTALRGTGAGAGQGMLVRFAIGLEAADDLIADCEQALPALTA